MSLRPEEEHAAQAILRFLAGFRLDASFSEGDNPPDIVIQFGDIRLAVEVTGLHQYVSNDGREQPFLEIHAHTRRLVDRIRRAVAADTIVGYQVLARGPFSKQEEDEILEQAVVFIRSGEVDPVDIGPNGTFRIIPVLRRVGIGLGVGVSGRVPGGDGESSTDDHCANVAHAVDRAIGAKVGKVAQLSDYDLRAIALVGMNILIEPSEVIHHLHSADPLPSGVDVVLFIDDEAAHVVADPRGRFNPLLARGDG